VNCVHFYPTVRVGASLAQVFAVIFMVTVFLSILLQLQPVKKVSIETPSYFYNRTAGEFEWKKDDFTLSGQVLSPLVSFLSLFYPGPLMWRARRSH